MYILFPRDKAAMENQEDEHADRDRGIGDVEDRKPGKMIAKNVDVKEIDIDEIYDLAVEKNSVVKQHTVEHPVDEIADGSPENERKRESEQQSFVPHLVQVQENTDARDDGKKREEEFTADVNTECHAGVLDIRKTGKVSDDRNG